MHENNCLPFMSHWHVKIVSHATGSPLLGCYI